jgi:hypothetical protein
MLERILARVQVAESEAPLVPVSGAGEDRK